MQRNIIAYYSIITAITKGQDKIRLSNFSGTAFSWSNRDSRQMVNRHHFRKKPKHTKPDNDKENNRKTSEYYCLFKKH